MTNAIRHQLDGYMQSVEASMNEHAMKATMDRLARERVYCELLDEEITKLEHAQLQLRERLLRFLPRPSEVQPPPLAEHHFRDLPQQWNGQQRVQRYG